MSDWEALAESATPHALPPPSRLGNVFGWGLLALGVACLAACLFTAIKADSAEHAWDAALAGPVHSIADYNAIVAAEAAYRQAVVTAWGLFGAGFLTLCSVPGLVYAFRPRQLGGPFGRLLRMASASVARYRGLQQPTTLYQGLSWTVQGAGAAIFALVSIIITIDPAAFWFIFPALLLWPAAMLWGIVLLGGSRWFTTGRRELGADVGDHRRGIEQGG